MAGMSNKQQALWEQGQRYSQKGWWRQAADAYTAIVEHDPGFVPAWLELCSAKEHLDAYRDARDAVIRASRDTRVPPMIAMAVAKRLRQFEALPELQRYVEETRLPLSVAPEMLLDLVTFFASAGDHDRTLPWVQHILKLRPQLPEAHNMHGVALMFAGRSEESAAAFERAIALKPGYAAAYAILSRVAKIDAERNHVDDLRRLLARPGLSPKDESNYAHALHNELHELGEYDDAWEALVRCCRLRRPMQPYDAAKNQRIFDVLRATFDVEFARSQGEEDPLTPIFIVGLHRSGTTLLERILAGHPDVADAGETYSFTAQLRIAADHFCPTVIDLEMAERLAGIDYAPVGAGFMQAMRWRSRGKPFVTEKMNPNFILLGAIAKALPNARLLHMRRAPADTCFSNLRTMFTHEAAYSYDQVEMADYCKAYLDLMAHWREVLPGRVFDVDYDALVREPEAQARRIADHCGFAFRDTMLDVGRSSGAVATASSHQVRQGIVTNRGGIWREYAQHLGPLLDRLAAHGLV